MLTGLDLTLVLLMLTLFDMRTSFKETKRKGKTLKK